MDKAQLDSFRKKTQTAFASSRPGTFTYEGSEAIPAAIVYGTIQVQLDHGPKNLSSVTLTVDKDDLANAPQVGKRVEVAGTSFEVYEVGGLDSTRWIIRAATFPGDRK